MKFPHNAFAVSWYVIVWAAVLMTLGAMFWVIAGPSPAHAEHRWPFNACEREQSCVRDDYRRRYVTRHHRPYQARRYAAPRYDDRDDRRDDRHSNACLNTVVKVLSAQHSSTAEAKDSAVELWMAEVQYEHATKYMDLGNAVGVRWRCGPSDAGGVGRSIDADDDDRGRDRDSQLVRCRLWATPCRAPVVRDRDR